MKIQTVMGPSISKFDEMVNSLLDRGWKLARREVLTQGAPAMLYAEMVMLDEADMEEQEVELPTVQAAVEALRFTCVSALSCSEDGCPMNAWCQKNIPDGPPPSEWSVPE